MKARLCVVEGQSQGATLALGDRRAYAIGRGASNELRIKDRSVSREHCRIEYDGRHYWVVDNDSVNGTFVNDAMVRRYMLYDGDVVKVGQSAIVFQVVEQDKGQG